MTRNEILENLCLFDFRHPKSVELFEDAKKLNPKSLTAIILNHVTNTKSDDTDCTCPNCTSGKTKMAVAMLEMICCGNCKHDNPNSNYPPVNCRTCNLKSNWELKK